MANVPSKISTMCHDNIVNAVLTEEVIAKIRKLLARQAGFRVTDDELRIAIVENILQF